MRKINYGEIFVIKGKIWVVVVRASYPHYNFQSIHSNFIKLRTDADKIETFLNGKICLPAVVERKDGMPDYVVRRASPIDGAAVGRSLLSNCDEPDTLIFRESVTVAVSRLSVVPKRTVSDHTSGKYAVIMPPAQRMLSAMYSSDPAIAVSFGLRSRSCDK